MLKIIYVALDYIATFFPKTAGKCASLKTKIKDKFTREFAKLTPEARADFKRRQQEAKANQ